MPFGCENFITINTQQGISQVHHFLQTHALVMEQLLMQEVLFSCILL
jgi:hypothetical protein